MENLRDITIIVLLAFAVVASAAQTKTASVLLQEGLYAEQMQGDLDAAIEIYERILKDFPKNRPVAAKALLHIGQCYEKLGTAKARTAYERVVREYVDQSEIVAQARVRLAALDGHGAAGGLVTRRILADASGIGEVLTADGKYICHIDWDTGDMVQYEIASGQTRRITSRGGAGAKEMPYEYQAFSRDGKQITYDWYTKDSVPQLRVRNLDGSGLRTLYSEKGYDVHPLDWSPDAGSILAFRELDYSRRRGIELTLISTADGSVRVLRSIASGAARARFSPDGQFVAFSFVGGSPPNGDVFLMTADGRDEVVVARHPAEDQLLGWTPDGRSLLFFSDRAGTRDIWAVRIAGGKQQGEPELLKKDIGQDSMVLGLAPDGSLYYETHTASGRLYTGELDLETGKVLVPPVPVTMRYTTPAVQLTWSPDGRNLAYLSHPGRIGFGNNILTIRSAATGEERFLSPRLRGVNQISWALDARAIIALGFTETEVAAFRIDAETSAITKLVGRAVFPRLCPDGKTLVFLGEGGIRKHNLDTGEESEVVKTASHFDLSPDGREVVFQEDGVVKTVSLDGGEPRELFRGLAERYQLSWTRDGRYIIARSLAENHELWRVPAQGGTPLKLDLPKLLFFALHPDNSRFAFSVDEGSKSELWVMENFLPEAPTGPKGMTVRKVWEGLDVDDCGKISPDGKYLSYVDWKTGDLAVYEIATGEKRHLTNKGSWDESDEFAEYARWSPDSRQIVYSWYNKEEDYDLRVIGLDGSKPRVLYSDEDFDFVFPGDWSSDRKYILAWVWRKKKDNGEVILISVMDGTVQTVKELNKHGYDNFMFSPEGDNIIYDDPDGDISILSLKNRTERTLVKHPADDSVLDWGPDGKYLLFSSDRSGIPDIWAVKVDAGKAMGDPWLVKSGTGVDPLRGLGTTTKGSFYYSHCPRQTDVYVTEINPDTGDVASPPREAINHFVGSNATPDYSLDGKYMAYVSRRAPFNIRTNTPIGNVLCIRSLETGDERELRPRDLNGFGFPSWSPDGRYILVGNMGDDLGRWEMGLYIIDAQTGEARSVVKTQKPQRIHDHAWGADGKSVLLVRSTMLGDSRDDMRMEIVAREIESGAETELLSGTWRDVYSISRSPDGRWLAVLGKGKKRNLRIIPLAGGKPRVIHSFETPGNSLIFHVWSADGSYIFLPKPKPKQKDGLKWDLWRIPVEGGQAQSLGLQMGTPWWLSAHPDGRHIAFSSRASDYDLPEIWVMENFLPELNDRQ